MSQYGNRYINVSVDEGLTVADGDCHGVPFLNLPSDITGSAGVGDRTPNGVRLDVGLVPLSPRDNPATTSSPPPMKASTASDQKTFRRIALALLLHILFYRTETSGRCGP